jgi:putative ABC transport system permease protein
MGWTHAMRARLRLLLRGAAEERMEEEMRFHLEMETEKLRREGLSAREARRRAVLAFGGVEGHKERMRDGRTFGWTAGLSLDVKLGLRMLAGHRGLTLIGGFATAVAIAVGAIVFEVVTEVLRPAIPVEEGGRVVALRYATDGPGDPERRVLHDYVAWREELVSVEQLGAFRTVAHNLATGEGPPEPVRVAEITASGFLVARTPPLLGRYLVPGDERAGAPPVLVVGHRAWQSRFAGDPGIVGRTVRLGADPHVVVGVMPEGFEFPVSHQFWVPLRADPAAFGPREGPELHVFGRLAPGVTLQEAQAELTTVGRWTAAALPETHGRLRPRVLPYPREHLDGLDHPVVARGLRILQLLVGGLLVVVAVNLAVVFYARTVARVGEIAVRSALGASRRRILAQLFVEAFALSAIGAMAGLALAQAVLAWAVRRISVVDEIPFWIDLDLSGGTVLYALGLAVVAAAIMGVLPGLKATGSRLHASLRERNGGGGQTLGWVWTTLIVAQVAIAVAVLPLAVFTVWQVVRMEVAEAGFPADEFVVGSVALDGQAALPGDGTADASGLRARIRARQLELVRRLEDEPGVSGAAFSSGIPGIDGVSRRIELDGEPPAPGAGTPRAGSIRVEPAMLEAYGARIVAGRALDARDAGGAGNAVVVNRTFARRILGNRAALGQRFRYARALADGPDDGSGGEWYEIVGVVDDFPAVPLGLASAADGVANVYHPMAPGEIHPATLSVRFRGGVPAGAVGRIREIGAAIDPALQLRVRPLTELYGSLRSGSRLVAWGLALVTSSVLLLSAAGIYALMSFTVAQRTREIGIRAALGAHPRRILLGVFGRAARQIGLGLLVGSLLSGALFAATGFDPARAAALLASVAAIMLAVGLLAAAGPARRGLRVQPMEALRAD